MQDNLDHNATTLQEVTASRKAGRLFIFSISAIVIGGILLVSIAFSFFISQQQLTELTRKHKEVLRDINRNLDYVMSRSEDNPISISTAKSAQVITEELMKKELLINAEINKIIAETKFQRSVLGITHDEEITITNSDIDRNFRDKIDQFITASPALLRVGFSFWDATAIVEVHSGLFLKPLINRANTLREIQSRNVTVIIWTLIVVGFLVLLGIWLVWARLLRPNLKNLENTILSEIKETEAKKLAQKQLAESESELRTILDNTPGMIAGIDNNYCYVSANKAYLEQFQLGKEELLLGKHIKEVLGEEQWRIVRPHMEKALKGKRAAFDLEVKFPAGSRHVQVIYVPEKRIDGQVQRFFTLIVDNQDRYLAQEALRASEENLYITLDSIGDGVIATDNTGIVTLINPVAEQLTGFKSSEAINQPLEAVLHIIHGGTNERVKNMTDRLLKQKKILGMTDETVLISKEGSKYQISDSIAPIKDSSGDIIGMVLTIRDVTTEHKLRSELNQNLRLQSLGQLAGGISHDFNNLLVAIFGAAEVILMDSAGRLTEKDRHYIKVIMQTTQTAIDVTQQLISFSQKSNQIFSPLLINSEIESVSDILDRTIDKAIEAVIKDEAVHHKFRGNSSAIQNAILNICINAAHAMPGGGVLTLFIRNQILSKRQCKESNFDLVPGQYIEIRISDTGDGIKHDYLDQIFDPYFTTKSLGYGIGLASVYGTIVEHSGSITVQSSIGEGSEFRVLLPCTDMAIEKQKKIVTTYSSNNLGTILLVEDNENVRDVVEGMLQQLCETVMTANDGIEALALYQKYQTKIDLVIMDINMPKMNGAQAIAKLKLINPECAFIAITGFSESQILTQLDEQESILILKKPFSFAQLANALQRVM